MYDKMVILPFICIPPKKNEGRMKRERSSKTGFHERLCLIGLHCCGDLTPTMLKLYAKMPQFAAFVNFSCCYHKMSLKGSCWTQVEIVFYVLCSVSMLW